MKQNHDKFTLKEILGSSISRSDALAAIRADSMAYQTFSSFPLEEQEKLISFIQGVQGLTITYDSFFKHIMNPDTHPSRLSGFLSAILGQSVKVHNVLPLEGVRMSESGSFVIMDLAVELSNKTVVNVEIQKLGYLFPGERASCYLSDFVMRQYNRVKDQQKEHFSFRDLKPVILIVIMEKSSPEFKAVSPAYIHREINSFDSGAKVASLFQTIYISLDTFHSIVQTIDTNLKAWLTFLSSDQPADIIRLVSAYPEFLPCYHDIVEFRRNPKELMFMYSEALAILDRNTEIYMCELLKKEVEENKRVLAEMNAALAEKHTALAEKDTALAKKEFALAEKDTALAEKDTALAEKDTALAEKDTALAEKDTALAEKEFALAEKDTVLAEKEAALKAALSQISLLEKRLADLT